MGKDWTPGQGTVLQSYWFFVIDHKGFLIACMCVCSKKLHTNIFCGLELPSKIHIHACSCILALWNSKSGIQKWRTVTSPNAPRPIIVSSSKSSTPVLCRCNRMYSVSFRSRSFNILFCSSSVTSASANLRSSDHRLQQNHGYTHIKLHSSPLISTMKTAVKWSDCKKQRTQSVSLYCFAGLDRMALECANNPQQVCQRNSIQEEKTLSLPVQTYCLTSRPFLLTPICLAISGIAKLQPQTNEKG